MIKRQSLLEVHLTPHACHIVREMAIPRDAFIAQRYQDVVCIATPSEYCLVDLSTQTTTQIGLPISQSTTVSSARTRPSIVPMPASEDEPSSFLITSHSHDGTLGAFVRTDGEPTARLLEWPTHPRSVVAAYPYVCALLRDPVLYVHDMRTLDLVQVLPLDPAWDLRSLVSITPVALVPGGSGLDTSVCVSPSSEYPVLPALSCMTWLPVTLLLVGKQSLACLARRPATSVALAAAHASQWDVASACLGHGHGESAVLASHATTLYDAPEPEMRALAELVALHHVRHARFKLAAAWFTRAATDPRLLLSMWPDMGRTTRPPVPKPVAGAWAALPCSMDAVIEQHLSENYAPDLRPSSEAWHALQSQLARRARDMLSTVLQASAASDTSLATARLLLALDDPNVPAASVEPLLALADVATLRPRLETTARYVLLARMYTLHGDAHEAIRLARALQEGKKTDAVDTLDLAEIADMAAELDDGQRAALALWMTARQADAGLQVGGRTYFSCC